MTRSFGVAPRTSGAKAEGSSEGATLQAQEQQARFRSQAARVDCSPTFAGGASPTTTLGALSRTVVLASNIKGAAAGPVLGAPSGRLATTGFPRAFGLVAVLVLGLGAFGWRRPRQP